MLKLMHFTRKPPVLILFLIFLNVFVNTTYGQSYYLSLSHINPPNFFTAENTREPSINLLPAQLKSNNHTSDFYKHFVETNFKKENEEVDTNNTNNTTIIVYKNSITKSPELSQAAMDIITIVWYVATFLALAAFFLLMACSDRRCDDAHRNARNNNEAQIPPPTPSPSYSEFAPPSYDTVIKMQNDSKTSIFVIPFTSVEDSQNKDNNNNGSSNNIENNPTTPVINFYTINELQKLGS